MTSPVTTAQNAPAVVVLAAGVVVGTQGVLENWATGEAETAAAIAAKICIRRLMIEGQSVSRVSWSRVLKTWRIEGLRHPYVDNSTAEQVDIRTTRTSVALTPRLRKTMHSGSHILSQVSFVFV